MFRKNKLTKKHIFILIWCILYLILNNYFIFIIIKGDKFLEVIMNFLIYFIQFLILFLICFLYYRLISLRSLKSKKVKTKNKELPEVKLFILLNKIDIKKIDYLKLAKQLTNLISISLALTVTVGFNLFENIFARIAMCLLLLVITIFVSYKTLGYYYKKKGMIKNVQS